MEATEPKKQMSQGLVIYNSAQNNMTKMLNPPLRATEILTNIDSPTFNVKVLFKQ